MSVGAERAHRRENPAATVVALDGSCALPRERIGGKAWSIDRMRALGLPVPPAFALTTDAWADFTARGEIADGVWRAVCDGIAMLEHGTGRTFGSVRRPLLVSVRSGAAVSMPGMMDTVLNLGVNADVARALAVQTGSRDYADDTRERFRAQYRETVLGDPDAAVPHDPWQQLRAAIAAVFRSWDSERATAYRRHRGLPDDLGTAVTVQAMVFGNLDARSGTGVLFSRDPNTGDGPAYGEWLAGGQGEDVVSGRVTPRPLAELAHDQPEVHRRLVEAAVLLERDGRNIQDIEFTVESGTLWLLQSRPAKRSARAAVRAAVAMAGEGLIEPRQALARVTADQVRAVLRPSSGTFAGEPLARGESACPGIASGIVVTDPAEAEARARSGADVILVRPTTSPADLHGMIAARAVVTEFGGATSHAALVTRELGRPCVVGCGAGTTASLAGRTVTVDGGTGTVWLGRVPARTVDPSVLADVRRLSEWAGVAPEDLPDRLDEVAGDRNPAPVARDESTGSRAVSELEVLRLVGVKGRVRVEGVVDSSGGDAAEVAACCAALADRGLCASTPAGLRLTPEGRREMEQLLAQERSRIDRDAVAAAYDEFCVFNAEVKKIVTAWQMRGPAVVNDHADAEYDAAVLDRLGDLHHRVRSLAERLGGLVPRLGRYRDRLDLAADRIAAGEHAWVARPVADSYHTVWFELHEDLIGLCGLNRSDEAAAGRAH
ncbi:pyruvate,orthophosphate dikinase [Nocardia transvalensis]|uniref:Pyruvate,orthophosphate dikinase n=1 Tax=Nocardia transvalensis TaxID=37333 RepID=A0A7W9PME8_9NOCA|nr:pyruvate, phosphate dikinase [Nocardia transvalensis]MBB5918640.1 pyruvate,orthophosphate dikinase [Nocardia transvalensis]